MKNFVEKLKRVDWAAFGIDHGEKIVLSLVVLFVAYALSSSQWMPETRQPEDLQKAAETAAKTIRQRPWPADQKTFFSQGMDLDQRLAKLQKPLEIADYAYTAEMSWPLYKPREPNSEPEWLAINRLLADSGRALLEQVIEEAAPVAENPAGAAPAATPNPVTPIRRTPGGGPAGPAPANTAGPAVPATVRKTVGQGYHYVAVRGVFPLFEQALRMSKAVHQPVQNAAGLVEIVDFQLERQTAIDGSEPWSGPWEPVDLPRAKEVLDKASQFESEVVDTGVTNSVFTMPLPQLAIYTWNDMATHPDVRDYVKSPDGQEIQNRINALMAEVHERMKDRIKTVRKSQAKGFSQQQVDANQIRQEVLQEPAARAKLRELQEEFGRPVVDEALNPTVSAAGRLLLFRYLDFAVMPGGAYRYRVRLVMRNPNFLLPLDQVAHPDVAEGEFRTTAWSEPTAPVFVEPALRFFVKETSPRTRTAVPTAGFDVYQWREAEGTPIWTDMKVAVGQFLSQARETEVVNPVAGRFAPEKVDIRTQNVLVDVDPLPNLPAELHPDLQLDPKSPSALVQQVLVADEYGEVAPLDTLSTSSVKAACEKDVKTIRDAFIDLRGQGAEGQGRPRQRGRDDLDDAARRFAEQGRPDPRSGPPTLVRDNAPGGQGGNPLRRAAGNRR